MQTDLIFDEKSNYSPKQRNMEVFRGAVQRRNRDETHDGNINSSQKVWERAVRSQQSPRAQDKLFLR